MKTIQSKFPSICYHDQDILDKKRTTSLGDCLIGSINSLYIPKEGDIIDLTNSYAGDKKEPLGLCRVVNILYEIQDLGFYDNDGDKEIEELSYDLIRVFVKKIKTSKKK